MTLAEFKAWLEGFEHSFTATAPVAWPHTIPSVDYVDGFPQVKYPNAYDWLMIKEKLALVGNPVVSIPQMQKVTSGESDYLKQVAAQQYPKSIISRTTA